MALLFFYGSRQNVDGMKMVLPHMKKAGVPFLLINAKVPSNDEVAKIEEHIYMEGAYETLCGCDPAYSEGKVAIDDETAEHFPIKIFLREDISEREINVADKVKLRNYSSSIKWESCKQKSSPKMKKFEGAKKGTTNQACKRRIFADHVSGRF